MSDHDGIPGLSLKANWESFRQFFLAPDIHALAGHDPELLARICFAAGAQSVLSLLEMDRKPERFSLMIDESQRFRFEVSRQLQAYLQATEGKPK